MYAIVNNEKKRQVSNAGIHQQIHSVPFYDDYVVDEEAFQKEFRQGNRITLEKYSKNLLKFARMLLT